MMGYLALYRSVRKTYYLFHKYMSVRCEPIYFVEYQIGFRINLELPFILILSYVVLFPGLASFLLWIKGISMIGANRSGVFLHLMPILSAIMAMIFFSEKFMFYHILGACFIVTGILLSNKKVKNA